MKQATAVVLQATDRAIGAEVSMHRSSIAVDAEIGGAAAEVIGVSRAAHSGVARWVAAGRVDRDWPVRSRHLVRRP